MKKSTLAKYLAPAPIPALRSEAPDSALVDVRGSFTGGKGQAGVYHRIIGQMPPHSVYVEAFLGAGRVFHAKRPALVNVLVDLNSAAIAEVGAVAGVRAIVGDALEWLPKLRREGALTPNTVLYCDPPFLLGTRQGRFYYDYEMSDEQHRLLLNIVLDLPCRVLLSGYQSDLYAEALKDWRVMRYRVRTRGRTVTECLWCNFPEPDELHDWRYAGRTYRERLYLRRLVKRWLAKLDAMPPRKRGYVLNAIGQRQDRREDPARCPGDDL